MARKSDQNDLIIEDEYAGVPKLARWLPPLVVLGVVGGFIGLAWYAYHNGTQPMKDDELPVIEADKTPVKEKPLDPGGMQFPNQDKTVFETFAGNNPNLPKVERVLPPPEEPLPQGTDSSGTSTWINDKIKKTPADEAAPASKREQVIPPPTTDMEAKAAAVAVPPPAAVESAVAAIDPNTTGYIAKEQPSAPVEISEVPVKAAPPDKIAKPVALEEPKKHAAQPAKAAPAHGVQVQLGAYRSEKEAHDAWNKMIRKYAALGSKQPVIVKADLGAKGVYYRLRAAGFASSAEAKSLCSKLSASGQACILPTN